jgi:hypothetical protein
MQSNIQSQPVDVSDKAKREEEFRLYLAILRMLRRKKAKPMLELYFRYKESGSTKDIPSKADTNES